MLHHKTVTWSAVLGVFLSGLLAGCQSAPKQQAPSEAVFFPAPPAPPRLQFLTSFRDARAFANIGGSQTSLSEWIVGKDKQDKINTRLDGPYGVAAYHGVIYVCDVGIDVVHVIDIPNKQYRRLEAGDLINNPVNITIAADGTKYVCDTGSRRVLVFDAQDKFVKQFSHPEGHTPIDLAIGKNELYVVDVTGGKIDVFSPAGEYLRSFSRKGRGPDELSTPTNLEVAPDGRIYVTDTFQQVVKIFDAQGRYLGDVGGAGTEIGSFARPKGITIDPNGYVYVADSQWDVIQIFNPEGHLMLVFGEPGDKPYSMGIPAGISVDTTSLKTFEKFVDPTFKAEYLLFVVNQFGRNRVAVFAFGHSTLPQPPAATTTASPDSAAPAPADAAAAPAE